MGIRSKEQSNIVLLEENRSVDILLYHLWGIGQGLEGRCKPLRQRIPIQVTFV